MRGERLTAILLDLPPRKAARSVRQALAFLDMLDAPGPRAEDVQLLVAPGHRSMRPGLVFLSLSHARA